MFRKLYCEVVGTLFGATTDERYRLQRYDDQQRERDDGPPPAHRDHGYFAVLKHFRSIPQLFPDIEYYFTITGIGLGEHLVALLLLPLKALFFWRRLECRDHIALALVTVCVAVYWLCGVYTTQLYSYLYHGVRRTSFIKLVMVFNILDVADKVLSSFSQDTLEIMFACVQHWQSKVPSSSSTGAAKTAAAARGPPACAAGQASAAESEPPSARPVGAHGEQTRPYSQHQQRLYRCREVSPGSSRSRRCASYPVWLLIGSTLAAAGSCVLHALVLLLSVVTLNVAINGEGNSLLALLVSNNFNELRSVIFKKYTAESLHNICAVDALERLQFIVFALVMMMQHMHERFSDLALLDGAVVLLVEVAIDFVKHLFASRFNGVPLTVFRAYSQLTMLDIAAEKLFWRLPALTVVPTGGDGGSASKLAALPRTADSAALIPALLSPSNGFAPKNVRRIGFNAIPYAALVLWSFLRIAHYLITRAPLVLLLLLLTIGFIKLVLSSMVFGLTTRFVLRTIVIAPPQRVSAEESPMKSGGGVPLGVSPIDTPATTPGATPMGAPPLSTAERHGGGGEARTVVHLSPLLCALLTVDRFDLQAGKARK